MKMRKGYFLAAVLAMAAIAAAGFSLWARRTARAHPADSFVGSSSCRNCHEPFYQLWSTSHHGLAMQPYSAELVRRAQFTASPEIRVGAAFYKAELNEKGGWVVERDAEGERRYPIEHT